MNKVLVNSSIVILTFLAFIALINVDRSSKLFEERRGGIVIGIILILMTYLSSNISCK